MSQHDLSIANQTFPATRSDINSALQALGSLQSGATAPATTYANQFWLDTTANVLKLRNSDNDAWIEIFDVDQVADKITLTAKLVTSDVGSQSAPSLTFDGDTDTGIYRSAANELSITTGGSQRLIVESDGDIVLVNGTPALKIKDVDSTGGNVTGYVQFVDSADTVAAAIKYQGSALQLEIGGSTVASFTSTGSSITPTGSLIQYAGSTAPSDWLLCDGSAVSRTSYASLFSVVGTTYGAGDGSTTFNLPDLRGRTAIGAGTGSGLTARSLGSTGGAETHTLSINEMPSHTHTRDFDSRTPTGIDSGGAGSEIGGISSPDYLFDTGSTGGDQAHNNMQPFLAINFIIKT